MLKTDRATERNRFFLAIANAAGDIIHFNSAECPIHNASPATESLLDYGPGELSGHPAMDIIHPLDRVIVLNAMASTVEGLSFPVREIRLVKKGGALIDAQMSTFFFKVDGRGRVGAVLREVSGKKSIAKRSEKDHAMHRELESDGQQISINALEKGLAVPNIIPICMYCNKIQSQFGTWMNPVSYLLSYTGADLSHGICPECAWTRYSGFSQKNDLTGEDD